MQSQLLIYGGHSYNCKIKQKQKKILTKRNDTVDDYSIMIKIVKFTCFNFVGRDRHYKYVIDICKCIAKLQTENCHW